MCRCKNSSKLRKICLIWRLKYKYEIVFFQYYFLILQKNWTFSFLTSIKSIWAWEVRFGKKVHIKLSDQSWWFLKMQSVPGQGCILELSSFHNHEMLAPITVLSSLAILAQLHKQHRPLIFTTDSTHDHDHHVCRWCRTRALLVYHAFGRTWKARHWCSIGRDILVLAIFFWTT